MGSGVRGVDSPGPDTPLMFMGDLMDQYLTLGALPMLVPPADVSAKKNFHVIPPSSFIELLSLTSAEFATNLD